MDSSRTDQNQNNRRRKILINKSIQFRYTFFVLALIIIYSSFLGYSLYTNSKATSKTFLAFVDDNPKLREKIQNDDRMLLAEIIIIVAINALVITYIGIFSTHKLAGPIYRFKKHLENIREGNLSAKTNLRKHDMLTDLAGEFNLTSDTIKGFLEEDINRIAHFSAKIKKINESIQKNQIESTDAAKALLELSSEMDKFAADKKSVFGLNKKES